jgi:teichuronic acid biosynthesis glycosyltransferase TuaG
VKNNDKLISIVMPAYNSEKYIEDAINSVLAQTYKGWELLVLDDGSTDGTKQIVENICKMNSRVKYIKNKKNLGVSATRNKGVKLSNGEWIAFLDSDDMWEPSKLQKQIDFCTKNVADFVFTGSSFINEKGHHFKGVFEVPAEVSYKKLRNHNVISCSSVLISKKYLKSIHMEKDEIHEDYAVWLKILKTGVIAYGINESLLIYRISRNSKSGNKLKTIVKTYKVYKFVGINSIGSIYFTIRHLLASLLKYKRIFR